MYKTKPAAGCTWKRISSLICVYRGPHRNAFAISPHWLCLLYSWLIPAIAPGLWRIILKFFGSKRKKIKGTIINSHIWVASLFQFKMNARIVLRFIIDLNYYFNHLMTTLQRFWSHKILIKDFMKVINGESLIFINFLIFLRVDYIQSTVLTKTINLIGRKEFEVFKIVFKIYFRYKKLK